MSHPAGHPSSQDAEAIVRHEPEGKKAELRLWLRMLTCTNMISTEIRRRLRAEFNVTLPQFDLLSQLHREPAGLRLSDLSRRMMVTPGNLTGLVDRLAAEGQIAREQMADDRRVVVVRMTDKGRRDFSAMAKAHEDWIARMFAGLNAKDIGLLTSELAALKKSVTDA